MKCETRASGFTLIELLAVTAIISVLTSMVGIAAFNARQNAYRTIAQTEVQQVAQALHAYWIARGEWPEGFRAGSTVEITQQLLQDAGLLGKEETPGYIQISPDRFEDGYYCDPWGRPYVVTVEEVQATTRSEVYQVSVNILNTDRFYHVMR